MNFFVCINNLYENLLTPKKTNRLTSKLTSYSLKTINFYIVGYHIKNKILEQISVALIKSEMFIQCKTTFL